MQYVIILTNVVAILKSAGQVVVWEWPHPVTRFTSSSCNHRCSCTLGPLFIDNNIDCWLQLHYAIPMSFVHCRSHFTCRFYMTRCHLPRIVTPHLPLSSDTQPPRSTLPGHHPSIGRCGDALRLGVKADMVLFGLCDPYLSALEVDALYESMYTLLYYWPYFAVWQCNASMWSGRTRLAMTLLPTVNLHLVLAAVIRFHCVTVWASLATWLILKLVPQFTTPWSRQSRLCHRPSHWEASPYWVKEADQSSPTYLTPPVAPVYSRSMRARYLTSTGKGNKC